MFQECYSGVFMISLLIVERDRKKLGVKNRWEFIFYFFRWFFDFLAIDQQSLSDIIWKVLSLY